MSIARSFGPVAEEMKEALEHYSKEELIDLLTHIVKTYVVEGTLPLKPETSSKKGDEKLSSLTFPQLILHLQMHLDHREWSLFSVSGEDVWVANEGMRVNLTGRQTVLPPAPSQTQTQAPTPTPTPARAPEPVREVAPPPQPAPAPPPSEETPPQATEEQVDRDDGSAMVISDDVEASERFGMLEFD